MQYKHALVLFFLPLLAAPVSAQDQAAPAPAPAAPKVELFVGYEGYTFLGDGSRVRFKDTRHLRFGVDWNVNDRIALVTTPTHLGVGTSTTTGTWVSYGFMAGPRLRFRQGRRVMPFVQGQLGMVRAGVPREGDLLSPPLTPPDRRTALQSAIGAGVDIRLNHRFSWRALQVEERSRFGPFDDHRLLVSSGIVIRFGTRK